jgi:hypothetical protein
VLDLVPAGAQPELDPAAAHLVDRRDHLREVPEPSERHRRDERPQPDPLGVAGQAGEHRPGVGRGQPARPREALVVVRSEERLEARGLGPARDRQLLVVGQPLLGLGHQGEAHRAILLSLPLTMFAVDAIVDRR